MLLEKLSYSQISLFPRKIINHSAAFKFRIIFHFLLFNSSDYGKNQLIIIPITHKWRALQLIYIPGRELADIVSDNKIKPCPIYCDVGMVFLFIIFMFQSFKIFWSRSAGLYFLRLQLDVKSNFCVLNRSSGVMIGGDLYRVCHF